MLRLSRIGVCASILFAGTLLAKVRSEATSTDDRRNPLGERADYELDKDRARTSSMISKGVSYGIVDKFLPDHPQGPSYNVALTYDITVKFSGRYQGTPNLTFPEEFFTPEFMQDLRRTGSYSSTEFKIKYEGRRDATTLGGGVYPQADVVLFYDINLSDSLEFSKLLLAMAGYVPNEQNLRELPIQDLKIRSHLFEGIRAIGAVKLDLSGTVNGISAKAGFDLTQP